MRKIVADPLLTGANVLLLFFIGIIGLSAVMLALGGPASLIFQDRIVAAFASDGVTGAARMFPALSVVLLALAALLGLAVYFLILLRRIAKSVGDGDPFIPVNAQRLSRMGWVVVVGEVASVPIGAAVYWVASIVEDSDNVRVDDDFGVTATGILLILVLFILARVFRHGAAMRDDLEGTV
jgi:Protein of unknown function (DUF2975)